MSRKVREKPVVVHPPIVELSVTKHNTRDSPMQMKANFNFGTRNIEIRIYLENYSMWSLYSISGTYDFHSISISQPEFVEYSSHSSRNERFFRVDTFRIDRHILMKQFTVKTKYQINHIMTELNSNFTFDVPYFQRDTRLNFKFLDQYHADSKITSLYNCNFKINDNMPETLKVLAREIELFQKNKATGNLLQMIKYAMNVEDLSSQDELKEYTLSHVEIDKLEDNFVFKVAHSQLPHGFEEMSMCIIPTVDKNEPIHDFDEKTDSKDGFFYVQVDKYNNNQLMFEKKSAPFPSKDKTYTIRFIPNRISYRACLHALDILVKNSLTGFFDDFEVAPEYTKSSRVENITEFVWFNKKISENEEQKNAIKNIVNCASFPFPYVVFGPPGTGKTSCLVECIAQILTERENSKILVTTQSNSACDEIGERLLKFVSKNKIFRFYSPSLAMSNSEVSKVLRETSNIRGKASQLPTKEEFFHFNVIIVTLMTCSRLVQLSSVEVNRHFNYIFIDEAGAATQPETYVPLIGLGSDYREITSNIVLFGDHKQLGPVIFNDVAERLGLGESLMERIMSKRLYLKDPKDKSYNEKYVTQLLDNFRSHEAILQFSNVLFYDSKLRAKVSEPDKSLGTRWNYLQNKKFPVIFHCVDTPSGIMYSGTSSFNDGEVKTVRFYIDLLLKSGIDGERILEQEIGIVSPYKAQLNKLREEFRRESKVEIGTTEYYQGREKRIIIVSTVKSGDTVGFLKSEKRLNVCFTRAKSLLIVIGNADTLMQNPMWKSFLQYCKTNGGCHGQHFQLAQMTSAEKGVQDELNLIFDCTPDISDSDIRKKEFTGHMKDLRHALNSKRGLNKPT